MILFQPKDHKNQYCNAGCGVNRSTSTSRGKEHLTRMHCLIEYCD